MSYRIIVCIKQVPALGEVRIDPDTHNLVRESVPSVLNPFDEFAIEEAVRIRERFGGIVTAITMGPPQAESALKTAVQMGADLGFLLTDRRLAGSDTLITALALSFIINPMEFDLVICGLETTDSSTAQVGPELAEKLNLSHVTYVSRLEFDHDKRHVSVTRETDSGYQVMRSRLPLLVTLVKGINVPREPDTQVSVKDRIKHVSLDDLSISIPNFSADLSPTQVVKIERAKTRNRAQFVIDSRLSARDRIRMIMQGGMEQKSAAVMLDEDIDGMLKKLGDFILQDIGGEWQRR